MLAVDVSVVSMLAVSGLASWRAGKGADVVEL
jgi:hypothetical protein